MLTTSCLTVRCYRPRWWMRIFALGILAFSSAGLIHFCSSIASGDQQASLTAVLVPALLTLVGLVMSLHFFTTTVTLEVDAIELQTIFGKKRLTLSEIRGRREYETTDSDGVKTRYIVLEPRDQSRPRLKFERIYNFDPAFETWLNQISIVDR